MRAAGDAAEPAEGGRESQGNEPEPPVWDPYAPLDPHDVGTLPIAPYRRARRRRGKPKQRQKQAQSSQGSMLASLLQPLGGNFAAGPSVLAFPEFAYALQVGWVGPPLSGT